MTCLSVRNKGQFKAGLKTSLLTPSPRTNAFSTCISNDAQTFGEKNKSYCCLGLDIQNSERPEIMDFHERRLNSLHTMWYIKCRTVTSSRKVIVSPILSAFQTAGERNINEIMTEKKMYPNYKRIQTIHISF